MHGTVIRDGQEGGMSDEVTVKLILIDTAAWLTNMLAAAARVNALCCTHSSATRFITVEALYVLKEGTTVPSIPAYRVRSALDYAHSSSHCTNFSSRLDSTVRASSIRSTPGAGTEHRYSTINTLLIITYLTYCRPQFSQAIAARDTGRQSIILLWILGYMHSASLCCAPVDLPITAKRDIRQTRQPALSCISTSILLMQHCSMQT